MEFKLDIENFSGLDTAIGTCIKSEPFVTHQGKCKWSLVLSPNGRAEEDEGYVSLYLELNEGPAGLKTLGTVFDLYIRMNEDTIDSSDEDSTDSSYERSDRFKTITLFKLGRGWGEGKFVSRSDILDHAQGYLSGDKLVVGVDFTCVSMDGLSEAPYAVTDNIEFFNTGEFSDYILVDADGKEIPVHKIVLAKHSRFFAAMFKSGMKEAVDGQATINRFLPEVLSKMLLFLYSGKFEINAEDAEKFGDYIIEFIQQVIKAGDYYGIDPLKTTCGQLLIDNLSCDTAISFLCFSHTYGCSELKEASMKFIDENKGDRDLKRSEQWMEMLRKNPEVANELLKKMLKL